MQSQALAFYSHMITPPRNLFTSGSIVPSTKQFIKKPPQTCSSKPWTFNLFISALSYSPLPLREATATIIFDICYQNNLGLSNIRSTSDLDICSAVCKLQK